MRSRVAAAIVLGGAAAALLAEPTPSAFESCESLLLEKPESRRAAVCFYEVAKAESGQRREAVARLRRHLEARPDLPWLWYALGNTTFGCRWGSEEAYRGALEAVEKQEDLACEIDSRVALVWNMARCGRELASIESEIEMAEASIHSLPEVDLPKLKIGLVRARLQERKGGDLEAVYGALRNLERRLFDPRYDGDPRAVSVRLETLRALGSVSYSLGRHPEDRYWFERMGALARSTGRARSASSARLDVRLANAALDALRPGGAPNKEEELLEILAAAHHPNEEARALLLLSRLEDGEKGIERLEACLELHQLDPRPRRRCQLALARRAAQHDPERARRLLAEARRFEDTLPLDLSIRVDAWDDHLNARWETLPRAEALEGIERVLAAIEGLRDQQSGMARPDIVHARADAYYWLAQRLITPESGEPELSQAFAVLERLRAQDLAQALGSAERARSHPSSMTLLDRLQQTLGNREAMVSFQIGPVPADSGPGMWIWLSTRQSSWVRPLAGDRYSLETQVDLLRDGKHSEHHGADLDMFYDWLLAPFLDELPADIDRLVIIPDGPLHGLPFAILGPENGPPVGARYEIAMTPSASLWLRWKERHAASTWQGPTGASVLVLADPEPSPGDLRQGASEAQPAGGRRHLPSSLPHARDEGRRVVRHLGGASRMFEGPDATKQRLIDADLSAYGLLHFAAHAEADEENPHASGVLLAASGEQEGWLRPADIEALPLEGKIVVLSTCDSARGAWRRGEGVMSLARSFFLAGAHAVVATLGPLPDELGKEFFDGFYGHLGRGLSLRQALAATQRQWIGRGRSTAAWGNFVVLGNGDLRPVPNGRPAAVQLRRLVLLAFLLTGMALVAKALWFRNWRIR